MELNNNMSRNFMSRMFDGWENNCMSRTLVRNVSRKEVLYGLMS